nr:MAG TPA: hypothetical protein [Caudoviricetes sp.]
MNPNFVEFVANYASETGQKLIIQTAAGTFIGNPIFADSKNESFDSLMDAYENSELYDEGSISKAIAIENAMNLKTGTTISFLIFSVDSILGISYGNVE